MKTHDDSLLGVGNVEYRVRGEGTLCLPTPSGCGHHDLEVCAVPPSSLTSASQWLNEDSLLLRQENHLTILLCPSFKQEKT